MRLLAGLLTKFIRNGRLRLYDAVGGLHEFGSGEDGPTVTVRLHDRRRVDDQRRGRRARGRTR